MVGSYIRLDANAIESATAGEYRTKAGYYGRQESASEKVKMPVFPVMEPESTVYVLLFRVRIVSARV